MRQQIRCNARFRPLRVPPQAAVDLQYVGHLVVVCRSAADLQVCLQVICTSFEELIGVQEEESLCVVSPSGLAVLRALMSALGHSRRFLCVRGMSGVGAISDMISRRASARRICLGGGGVRSCRGINRFSIQSGCRARIAINHSLTMCLHAQTDLGSFILGRRANARGGLDGARHVWA